MPMTEFVCPNCQRSAPINMFESMENGTLKCRCCRSRFKDPNAFNEDTTYADCDSLRAVTRYPFRLDGKNSMVRVRGDYLALAVGYDGRFTWLDDLKNRITDMPSGFQLYYICLTPRVSWGINGLKEFGAYGTARLSVSMEYAKSFCAQDMSVQNFEDYLQSLVIEHIKDYAQRLIRQHGVTQLKSGDGYANALGPLKSGVSITRIELKGYRDGNAFPVELSSYDRRGMDYSRREESGSSSGCSPVERAKLPQKDYEVKTGVEEVFIRKGMKTERHKAGEHIEVNALRNAEKIFRFSAKEFEFINGWGLYNQTSSFPGYYSAHGTISFYIDSTESLSLLAAKTASWEAFTEAFFDNVLKKEIATALKEVLRTRISQQGFDPTKIGEHLSAMSVDMTSLLNGESESFCKPAFKPYGLRVKAADILNVTFYNTRR